MTPAPLSLRPAAQEEIQEAYDWYELRRLGLGDEFLSEVRAVLAEVEGCKPPRILVAA